MENIINNITTRLECLQILEHKKTQNLLQEYLNIVKSVYTKPIQKFFPEKENEFCKRVATLDYALNNVLCFHNEKNTYKNFTALTKCYDIVENLTSFLDYLFEYDNYFLMQNKNNNEQCFVYFKDLKKAEKKIWNDFEII